MTQSGVGVIPQSTALSEASPDSLTELFARDPAGYGKQDLDKVIGELRAQRQRWQAVQEAGGAKATKTKVVVAPRQLDLGEL